MRRANVDCQPILSRHQVLKYIPKQASKTERRFESYHEMLTRFVGGGGSEARVLSVYRRYLAEILIEHDIGAQETCHLLLNMILVFYSHKLFSLNIGKKPYQILSLYSDEVLCRNNFIQVYES